MTNALARKEPTFKRLEKSVPREEMLQLLQMSADPRVQQLVECLLSTNPEMMKLSLPKMAGICRLTYPDLLRELSKSRVSEGVLRMSKHIPKVLEDTAIDAKSRFEVCDECRGTGEVIDTRPRYSEGKDEVAYIDCTKCSAKGKVRKAGNTEARKLVFEAAGLTNKSKPAVNVNVNSGAGAVPPVEAEMASLDRILDVQPVKQEKAS